MHFNFIEKLPLCFDGLNGIYSTGQCAYEANLFFFKFHNIKSSYKCEIVVYPKFNSQTYDIVNGT